MGFQIRSANPSVVHAVTKGGMAMNAGLVRGQAILKVSHDRFVTIIATVVSRMYLGKPLYAATSLQSCLSIFESP